MVLYKRKPVKFLPPEPIDDEDAEVWHIPQTGEVFASYENYLTRMDFYKQRRFNDQISGHSGMTFFEAFKNELAGGEEVEAAFPEALKGPVLRKAQFQTISRLDHLVDLIFDNFKHDYFPGEAVTVFYPDDEKRLAGLVRDKVTIGARPQADGSMSKPITRYLIFVVGRDEESSFEETQVSRERGVFTKAMIRSFMRKTVAREAWNGAPWLVKPDYAAQYYIDTRVPPHLRYDTKLLERKQLQAQKRASLPNDPNAQVQGGPGGPVRLPELKPASKAHKGKGAAGAKGKWPQDVAMHGAAPSNADMLKIARELTPPPPPKYPIEDLQLEPREGFVRPALEFLCHDPPREATNGITNGNANGTPVSHIDMDSVGPLLETWDTLNVYCEIFKLDSFTFDDFVEAMCVASEKVVVQLFEEIHCAVLKILVDSETDGGKVRITLPQLEDDDDSDEEDEEEDEEEEKTPEPEPKPTGRATRSSLAKAEAERIAAAAEEENLRVELETKHRAEDILEDYDWIEHLRKRDFPNGGWERIIVGLLHQLSKSERYEQRCEELLLQLVPPGEEPTQEGVSMNYAQLDLPYRVKALQIICMLTMETKTVRGYMEECSENMTKYRKDKIEWQRQKKQAIEELRQLNEQRKALQPPETAPNSPKPESIKDEEGESRFDADESQLTQDPENGDDTDQDNQAKRKRRKPQTEKQRKQEEEKEQKAKQKEKEKKDAVTPAVSKQLLKIQKEIQKQEAIIKNCEEEVAVIENDLREADCPRTRVLGKDRYWNRYYWFERNGMPYAGLPNSSTAEAEYANGCIWVQGPDELEREGYIDVPQEEQNEYKAKFGVTIPERKAKEEGGTSVFNARQWGYISDPAKVEELINWLDPRGFNELKLKKELVLFKDRIVQHMANRRKYLLNDGAADGAEEEAVATSKRTSSRIREKTPEPPSYKCLRWENTVALEELGHLHSDAPPKPRARKQTKKRESAMLEAAVAAPAKKTRRK